MDTILKTKNLCKYYGNGENEVKALQDVNIEIERGEFVAVVGKSGSGKSTLLHMLGGLDHPQTERYTLERKIFFLTKKMSLQFFEGEKSDLFFSLSI